MNDSTTTTRRMNSIRAGMIMTRLLANGWRMTELVFLTDESTGELHLHRRGDELLVYHGFGWISFNVRRAGQEGYKGYGWNLSNPSTR